MAVVFERNLVCLSLSDGWEVTVVSPGVIEREESDDSPKWAACSSLHPDAHLHSDAQLVYVSELVYIGDCVNLGFACMYLYYTSICILHDFCVCLNIKHGCINANR